MIRSWRVRSNSAGQEDTSRQRPFLADAGEPGILCGTDTGPNPAEYLLHALAACLTTSLVYVAAARKVRLTRVESHLEGDMDVQGALGLDDEVPNRFSEIRATFTVEGDAPVEKLREVVLRATDRSAVFDSVTSGVPVHVDVVTCHVELPCFVHQGDDGVRSQATDHALVDRPDVAAVGDDVRACHDLVCGALRLDRDPIGDA